MKGWWNLMDRKTAELIKKNKGLLKQLTDLHLEIYKLKIRILILEQKKDEFLSAIKRYERNGLIEIPVESMSEEKIANIKVGGTDPD